MNVAGHLDRAAAERPQHPAVILDGGASFWTYAQLNRRASQVVADLRSSGVVEGDRVALFLTNSGDHVAAWFAVTKLGAIVVDVNILLGDEEWAYTLDDCTPSVAIIAAPLAERVSALCVPRNITAVLADHFGPAVQSSEPASGRHDDDAAVIAYTSGTTGRPKGVVHCHGRLNLHIDLMAEVLSTTGDDVMITFLPLFPLHAFLCQAALAVAKQATLIVMERYDPVVLAGISQRYPISSGTLVPAIVTSLLALSPEERPAFVPGSRFNVGGAPLHPATKDEFESVFGVTLLQGFGSTEVMGAVAMERADHRAPWGSCGSLWPGLEEGKLVRVVDDDGLDVPAGEVGEFTVHRSRSMVAYWNAPALTQDAFLDGEWFRMGDLGRIDEDGFVYLLDRKKDMIIRGGFNIFCAEIERVLTEHEAVAEVAVVGVPHDRLGEVPKAFVVLSPAAKPSDDLAGALAAEVRRRLGPLKVPAEIEFAAPQSLPRNAMGKILKRELRGRLGGDEEAMR
jgi:long-chain acyl-CoA synthetase